ncbi:DUF3828 domain-containing protein [Escherichia coli]|uniref:DUF3828 domain-containing protein n=1 Tax=Escherichia coli TaxID=562 RepID=UPI002576D4BA|nr:DUF3828 domain-containing protein [Escherichia coli]
MDYDPLCYCLYFVAQVLDSVAITQTGTDHATSVVSVRICNVHKEQSTETRTHVSENGRWVMEDIISNHGIG